MPYCTLDNIKALVDESELISLTDDSDTGEIRTLVVDASVQAADAIINSYLIRQYRIPMDPVPDMVQKLSEDIAVYNLFSRRGRTTDAVDKRYDDAIKFLKDVAKGNAGIIGAQAASDEVRGDRVQIRSSARIFSRESMGDF